MKRDRCFGATFPFLNHLSTALHTLAKTDSRSSTADCTGYGGGYQFRVFGTAYAVHWAGMSELHDMGISCVVMTCY
jgi:hypothetical protein